MMQDCTASCAPKAMLELAVDALVEEPCPFIEGGGMHDGLHVDYKDPECYARDSEDYKAACRQCITEALEERVQPDATTVVARS